MKKMDVSDWYLDINTFKELDTDMKDKILSLFRDMCHFAEDGRKNMALPLFNTLRVGGFIKNFTDTERLEKIDLITHE
jgi:hypothetical protein